MKANYMCRQVAVVFSVGLLLFGCSSPKKSARDGKGAVTKAGVWSVFDLRDGDCLAPEKDLGKEVETIPVVPCSEPHTQEVYSSVKRTGDVFPGVAEMTKFADKSCVAELQTKLGVSPSAGFYVSYLLPSFDSWNKDNDRSVTCVLVFPAEKDKKGSAVAEALAMKK
jgi:hypothetical protein